MEEMAGARRTNRANLSLERANLHIVETRAPQALGVQVREMDTEMKLALSGVNLKEPVRVAFVFAPPIGRA